jgi:hypothetical protein
MGVLEHCFNIPIALKNIFKLLKVGGRAILFNPTIQPVDTGFFSFQPTAFHDYFKANGWRLERISLFAFPHGKFHNSECDTIIEYEPGLFDLNPFGLDGRRWGVHTVVTKLSGSTWERIPNQRRYREIWEMTQIMPELNKILGRNKLAVNKIAATMDFDQLVEVVRYRLMQNALAGRADAEAQSRLFEIAKMYNRVVRVPDQPAELSSETNAHQKKNDV